MSGEDVPSASVSRAYLAVDDAVLVKQCEVDCFRAPGPGGQKRNKTSSGVRLRHRPTGLSALATEDRSQHVNKARAIRRLRMAIALELRTPVEVSTYEPSELTKGCITRDRRLRISPRNEDYAMVVGEVFDLLAGCGVRADKAAQHLDVSTASLLRFLHRDTMLWRRANEMRTALGMRPLRSPR